MAPAENKYAALGATEARQPLLVSPKQVVSSSILVSGQEVEVFQDELYRQVRVLHGVPDNFLNMEKAKSVDFNNARKETAFGKGGTSQFITSDGAFIVKQVPGGDHDSLTERCQAYVDRLLSGDTFLVPIYLHFRAFGKLYVAMANLTRESGPWNAKYDLKGCADDKTIELNGKLITPVRKRFYKANLWCSCNWSSDRWLYYEGKERARKLVLDLPKAQRDEIVRRIEGDADWLIQQGLMDYSLYVAVRKVEARQLDGYLEGRLEYLAQQGNSGGWNDDQNLQQPVHRFAVLDGEYVRIITVAIIDFLQPWNAAKKVAQCIKALEFNKATVPPPEYGQRFKRHFAERLKGSERLRPLPRVAVKAADACTASK